MSPCFAQHNISLIFCFSSKLLEELNFTTFETIKRPNHRARKVVIRADGFRDFWYSNPLAAETNV